MTGLDPNEPPSTIEAKTSAATADPGSATNVLETIPGDREQRIQKLIAAANERDDQADVRDANADKRDQAASLTAFLAADTAFDVTLNARRSAAVDRLDAKLDRTASAQDRSELTDGDS